MYFRVERHPSWSCENEVWLGVVTSMRGNQHFVTIAGDKPTVQRIKKLWTEEKSAFQPLVMNG
jgi:hypothetical protein